MNEIVEKFLLAGDKFMSKMHLRQPGFTYSACRPFIKKKERLQKLKETGDSRYIYQNELDKACFQLDRLMEILNIYLEKQILMKFYLIKHLISQKIQNMTDIKRVLLQWLINFLMKRLQVVLLKVKLFKIKN